MGVLQHGALRPTTLAVGDRRLGAGDRVRLRPQRRADILDLAMAGRLATIVSVEQDFDDRAYFAVTLDDDPGPHRFFFAPDEVEPLPGESAD